MDDRTMDLSIMHKTVREMTGTLLVGSLQKQAINLQGNNNDSSQGNKGHPLLPIVINLTHSSIGWKKNASSPTTQESYTVGTSTSQLDMQSSLFTEERIQFQFFTLDIFLLCQWRGGGGGGSEHGNGWNEVHLNVPGKMLERFSSNSVLLGQSSNKCGEVGLCSGDYLNMFFPLWL